MWLVEIELCSQTEFKNAYICVHMYWDLKKAIAAYEQAVTLVTTPLGSSKEQMMILNLF